MDSSSLQAPLSPPHSTYNWPDDPLSTEAASSSRTLSPEQGRVRKHENPSNSAEMDAPVRKKRRKKDKNDKNDKKIEERRASSIQTESSSQPPSRGQTAGKRPPAVYMDKNQVLEFADLCNRHWREAVAKKDAEIERLRGINTSLHEQLLKMQKKNRKLRARLACSRS